MKRLAIVEHVEPDVWLTPSHENYRYAWYQYERGVPAIARISLEFTHKIGAKSGRKYTVMTFRYWKGEKKK